MNEKCLLIGPKPAAPKGADKPAPKMAIHDDGFGLIEYKYPDGKSEVIYNATPGWVTDAVPTHAKYKNQKSARAERVKTDKPSGPMWDYVPAIGTRVFIPITEEKARQYAKDIVAKQWQDGKGDLAMRYNGSKTAAIQELARQFYNNGNNPDLVVVDKAIQLRIKTTIKLFKIKWNAQNATGKADKKSAQN